MVRERILTEEQETIVKRRGLFVVKACPGSGKTLTVADRLAELLSRWKDRNRGIATISFTNVAWQEIEKYLNERINISTPIPYPHFLSTIDSFINQHIFLPFGHLVMGCKQRPELIGPPINNWEPIGSGWYWKNKNCHNNKCRLNDFTYDVNDNLINVSPRGHLKHCDIKEKICEERKTSVIKKGLATQSDARYFAMKVLQKFPPIAKALAYRFPFLMIDEAQDTSEIEMKIIDLLIQNGLKEVMFIGDPDQAIFEWRDEKPELIEEKYKMWETNSIILSDNWRSSQNICNFFHKISSLPTTPNAMNNDVSGFEASPEIWSYNGNDYQSIIVQFHNLCERNHISLTNKDVAVLTRGRNLVKEIKGSPNTSNDLGPWKDKDYFTESVCESKYLFERGEFSKGFHKLERAICRKTLSNGKQRFITTQELIEFITEYGFTKWRKGVYKMLTKLPNTDCPLGQWLNKARKVLSSDSLISAGELAIKKGKYGNSYSSMSFNELFAINGSDFLDKKHRLATVHSVKGETLEAVLLILKSRAANNKRYINLLDKEINTSEELRIAYVAITRPRILLVIAVPKEDKPTWDNKFFG